MVPPCRYELHRPGSSQPLPYTHRHTPTYIDIYIYLYTFPYIYSPQILAQCSRPSASPYSHTDSPQCMVIHSHMYIYSCICILINVYVYINGTNILDTMQHMCSSKHFWLTPANSSSVGVFVTNPQLPLLSARKTTPVSHVCFDWPKRYLNYWARSEFEVGTRSVPETTATIRLSPVRFPPRPKRSEASFHKEGGQHRNISSWLRRRPPSAQQKDSGSLATPMSRFGLSGRLKAPKTAAPSVVCGGIYSNSNNNSNVKYTINRLPR